MSARLLPRSVFGQLALVIALVLLGSGLLALLLVRELAVRPASEQLLQAMDGFASVVEELDRSEGSTKVAQQLREAGLEIRHSAPPERDLRGAPFLRALRERAVDQLGPGREVRLGRHQGRNAFWLKLDTPEPLWVSFALEKRGQGVRRFSLLMLVGSIALVWLAAAYFARRLVQPLRQLAHAAPGIVRGDPSQAIPTTGPREVVELAQALTHASDDVRAAAEERAFMLAGISHDLRTPLTRLQFAVELLPQTDPELRAGIDHDIGEIDAILTQFIAYARDGRDEPTEALDLAEICRNALAAADPRWEVSLPDAALMQGKPMALLRAVENLLVNAERHGAFPFALKLDRQGDVWQVEVSDQGIGLPASATERVKQPFVHAGDTGGSGLGLAIVDRVARQHGGDLVLLANTPSGLRALLRVRGA